MTLEMLALVPVKTMVLLSSNGWRLFKVITKSDCERSGLGVVVLLEVVSDVALTDNIEEAIARKAVATSVLFLY